MPLRVFFRGRLLSALQLRFLNSSLRCFSSVPAVELFNPSPRAKIDYSDLPAIALKLYQTGIEEVSSTEMLKNTLKFNKSEKTLEALNKNDRNNPGEVVKQSFHIDRNVYVVGIGKAVTGMCRSVEELLGDDIVRALAVVPAGTIRLLQEREKYHLIPSSKFEIISAGDGSLPDHSSLEAAKTVTELLSTLTKEDLLITLISGGGSALTTYPKPPLTLDDKILVTKLMKYHGVTTLEQNTVRKNLSLIKGGGLSSTAAPAQIISLVLSNLPHNQSAEVASGLTTPDSSTPQQALEILRKYKIDDKIPPSVMKSLQNDIKESADAKLYREMGIPNSFDSGPKPRHDTSNTINIMTGSDEIAVGAILSQCAKFEIPACAVTHSAKDPGTKETGRLFSYIAQYVAYILKRLSNTKSDNNLVRTELECIRMGVTKSELNDIARAAEDGKNMRRPVCLIFTSEITVELRGRGGMGGPCQEVALATAIALRKRHKESETFRACDVQLFSIDSDGRDGSTDVAGAIANCDQADQLVNGHDAEYYLANNDSYAFYAGLENGKFQVDTGITGTDIQNFQLLIIRDKSIDM